MKAKDTSNVLIGLAIVSLFVTMFDARLGFAVSVLSLIGMAIYIRRLSTL